MNIKTEKTDIDSLPSGKLAEDILEILNEIKYLIGLENSNQVEFSIFADKAKFNNGFIVSETLPMVEKRYKILTFLRGKGLWDMESMSGSMISNGLRSLSNCYSLDIHKKEFDEYFKELENQLNKKSKHNIKLNSGDASMGKQKGNFSYSDKKIFYKKIDLELDKYLYKIARELIDNHPMPVKIEGLKGLDSSNKTIESLKKYPSAINRQIIKKIKRHLPDKKLDTKVKFIFVKDGYCHIKTDK